MKGKVGSETVPGVAIEAHDDALDATTILRTSTLTEYLIYLFFRCVKTQVTNLKQVSTPEGRLEGSTHI